MVASYKNGFNKFHVYSDRVEFGLISMSVSYLEDIEAVEVGWSLPPNKSVRLVLKSGKKTQVMQLFAKDAAALQTEFARLKGQLVTPEGVTFRCTVLGGNGTSLSKESLCTVTFGPQVGYLASLHERFDFKLSELTAVKLDGPGRVVSNAGIGGGGLGLEGAVVGIGAAALINALTTKTTTNTVLYLAWRGAEIFLHTSQHTPEEARLLLSHVFLAIDEASTSTIVPSGRQEAGDLVAQFERLASLLESGVIDADEFKLAKARILRNSQ